MKLLHTGDIHLDSPFSASDPAKCEQQRRELRSTFSEMMSFAADERVDMVLICGDLFDCAYITRETLSLISAELGRLSCPVIVAPGNHDPAGEGGVWSKVSLPENVYVFGESSLSRFDFDALNCSVYGYGFTSQHMRECPLEGKSAEAGDRINIVCAHGDTASPLSPYCPVTPAQIRAFGADYCALGHIHSPEAANSALEKAQLAARYCGCPQGRDFGEAGVKGANLVTVTKEGGRAQVSVRFQPFSKRVYRNAELVLDMPESMSHVISEIRAFIEASGWGDETLLSLTLKGRVSPSLVIFAPEAEKECAGSLYSLKITDETVPAPDTEGLALDRGIRGEVYRQLLPKIENGTPEERRDALRALKYSLAALDGGALL